MRGTDTPSRETVQVIEQILQVEKVMTGPGFDARRATAREMAFLFHRSLSMGVPAPVHAGVGGERWEVEDLAEFTERRVWLSEPYGSSVRVVSEIKGTRVTRAVAVLTMGIMPDRTWPEDGRDPWMLASNRLGFPVEWSLSGTLMSARTLSGAIEFEQNRAAGHRVALPGARHDAAAVGGPGDPGRGVEPGRGDGGRQPHRRPLPRARSGWRSTATTEDEALKRARDLVDLYGERLNMPLQHTRGQARALREFIPGEPRAQHGFQRRMPVRYLASALPNVDSVLGTPTGPYLGYGIGSSRRASRFDMHYGPEVLQTPGLFPIVAEPGGGKSVLIGTLAYNAVRAGQPTIIFDPSGPLARLAQLPELAPFSRVLDLSASKPGTLSPYQLVPDPTREGYTDAGVFNELEFERAARRAAAERQQLMFDVLRMWLPSTVLRLPGTDVMLRDALRRVAEGTKKRGLRDTRTNPRWIIEQLEKLQQEAATEQQRELARQLVEELKAAAEFPLGELIMPPHRMPIEDEEVEDKTLVVVTMPGLSPPPEAVEREFWGSEERYTQPLLHLAAFFASKFIYAPAAGRPQERVPRREPPDGSVGVGSGVLRPAVAGLAEVEHRDRRGQPAPGGPPVDRPGRRADGVGVRGPADQGVDRRRGVPAGAVPGGVRPGDPGPVAEAAGRADRRGDRRVRVAGPAGPSRQDPDRPRLASGAAGRAADHPGPGPAGGPADAAADAVHRPRPVRHGAEHPHRDAGGERGMTTAAARIRRHLVRLLLIVGLVVVAGLVTAGPASADICQDAPAPVAPKSGLPGMLTSVPKDVPDAAPDPFKDPAVPIGSVYGYNWGWANFDLGCGSDFLRDPVAVTNTKSANVVMAGLGGVLAGLGSLEEMAKTSSLDWLTTVVGGVADKIKGPLLGLWLPIGVLGVGLILAYRAKRAAYADTLRAALIIGGAVAMATFALVYPAAASKAVDNTVVAVSDAVGEQFSASASDAVTRESAYRTWLTGNFGDPDSAVARELGPRLMSATHYTWSDMKRIQADAGAKKAIDQAKAAEFKDVAKQLKDRDPGAYEVFTGRGERTAPALLGIVVVLCMGLFIALAMLMVLISRVMMQGLALAAPLAAVLGVLPTHTSVLARLWDLFTAAIVAVAKFVVAGGVMAFVLGAIQANDELGAGAKLFWVVVATVVALVLTRPIRSFKTIVPGLDPNKSYLRAAVSGAATYVGARMGAEDGTEAGLRGSFDQAPASPTAQPFVSSAPDARESLEPLPQPAWASAPAPDPVWTQTTAGAGTAMGTATLAPPRTSANTGDWSRGQTWPGLVSGAPARPELPAAPLRLEAVPHRVRHGRGGHSAPHGG